MAILHRCIRCDKWSHAVKQPKKHQRWVDAWSPEYDPNKNENDGLGGNLPDGHFVDCGPFETYHAIKEEDFMRLYSDFVVQA